MAIFSSNTDFAIDVVACEGYDITLGGGYDAIMESFDDEQLVVEAMHAFDMAEFEVATEADGAKSGSALKEKLQSMWKSIKEWFSKMFSRMMAFFKSLTEFVSSIVLSGKAFANKYAERLKKIELKDFTYEMYEYNLDEQFSKTLTWIEKLSDQVNDDIEAINGISLNADDANEKFVRFKEAFDNEAAARLAGFRKAVSGEEDANKYTEGVNAYLRSGGKKKSIKVTKLEPYFRFLLASDVKLKYAKKANDVVKSKFAKMEQNINKAAAEAASVKDSTGAAAGAKKASMMRMLLNYNSSVQNLTTRYINAWASAVREATGVYKNLCVKALSASR